MSAKRIADSDRLPLSTLLMQVGAREYLAAPFYVGTVEGQRHYHALYVLWTTHTSGATEREKEMNVMQKLPMT